MNTKNILKFIAFIIIVFLLAFVLKKLGFSIDQFRENIEIYGIWGPLVFIGLFILGIIMFLPATPFDLAAGALFGPFWGCLFIVLGATIGASIAFFMARFLGKGFVEELITRRFKKVEKYKEYIDENGFKSVFLLRLVPIFPFNGLNFMFGVTKISFKDYFWGTFFGIMPASFSYVYFASSLATGSYINIVISSLLLFLIFGGLCFAGKCKKFRKLVK